MAKKYQVGCQCINQTKSFIQIEPLFTAKCFTALVPPCIGAANTDYNSTDRKRWSMVLETVVGPLPLLRHFKSSSRGVRGVGVGSKRGGGMCRGVLWEKNPHFLLLLFAHSIYLISFWVWNSVTKIFLFAVSARQNMILFCLLSFLHSCLCYSSFSCN